MKQYVSHNNMHKKGRRQNKEHFWSVDVGLLFLMAGASVLQERDKMRGGKRWNEGMRFYENVYAAALAISL